MGNRHLLSEWSWMKKSCGKFGLDEEAESEK